MAAAEDPNERWNRLRHEMGVPAPAESRRPTLGMRPAAQDPDQMLPMAMNGIRKKVASFWARKKKQIYEQKWNRAFAKRIALSGLADLALIGTYFVVLRKSERSRHCLHNISPWLLVPYYGLENWIGPLSGAGGRPQNGDWIQQNDIARWELEESLDTKVEMERVIAETTTTPVATTMSVATTTIANSSSRREKRPRLER